MFSVQIFLPSFSFVIYLRTIHVFYDICNSNTLSDKNVHRYHCLRFIGTLQQSAFFATLDSHAALVTYDVSNVSVWYMNIRNKEHMKVRYVKDYERDELQLTSKVQLKGR